MKEQVLSVEFHPEKSEMTFFTDSRNVYTVKVESIKKDTLPESRKESFNPDWQGDPNDPRRWNGW